MAEKKLLNIPVNRVEGDLEVQIEVEDGQVADVRSSGTMFRGFEKILVGRGALDGLVITPRICGICGTAHLTAAAKALDMIASAQVPDGAKKIRNLALMVEHVQSDMRHGFLMFTADFVNPAHQDHPLFEEAVRRYEPLKGETVLEVIRETKKVLEIVAILGGQWPHSSYMVPGGIVSVPSDSELLQCSHLLTRYRTWYERRILGCSLERWIGVRNLADLDAWLDESEQHRDSDLGFYLRFAREAGFEEFGKGHGNFISFGSLDMPEGTEVECFGEGDTLVPAGFAVGTRVLSFDQEKVAEYVTHSWYRDYEGGKHPFEGETEPHAIGQEGEKYSWAKAPRYDRSPAETGPLAEMIIAENPLFTDLVDRSGPNVFVRELARLVRPTTLMPAMEIWFKELLQGQNTFYVEPATIDSGEGFGLTQASRGALGHWVKISGGRIVHYQVITPTAWNASPRDMYEVRGPWEEALIGTRLTDPGNPVEVGHVIRSFDACLVCTVHAFSKEHPSEQRTVIAV